MQFYHFVIIYYLFVNVLAFFLYFLDKKKAEASDWRIPERTLIFFAALGGALGAYAGMHIWHHKTRKVKFQIGVPVWFCIHLVLICFVTWQNNHLVITKYQVDAGLDCRIVQVSDLHNVVLWWNQDYIADQVRELEPDLIVLTGDIIDANHMDLEAALYTAGELAKITDTYYVSGNHEYWLSQEDRLSLYQGLKERGVCVLSDEYVMMEEYQEPFMLIGLEDNHLGNGTLQEILQKSEDLSEIEDSEGMEDSISILLAHEPQYIPYYANAGIDYVLTGHAHGGQWILPGIGPVYAPDQGFQPEFTAGEVRRGSTLMIISRGLGNSVIPIRLFNYPELVVVDF